MMRLSEPEYSCEHTLDACIAGITGNAELRRKLTSGKPDLLLVEVQYTTAAGTGQLHTIPSINTDGAPPE